MTQRVTALQQAVYYLHFVRNRLKSLGKLDVNLQVVDVLGKPRIVSPKACIDELIKLIEEKKT